jgi:putative PIN family toxin of toxin-antitoxin system
VSQADCLRVVFDCMVYLQATARPDGPAARLVVDFVETGCLTLFTSEAILAEVHDVLSRPKIRAKNPAITDETVDAVCARIRKIAQHIDPVPISFSLPRDPDDEPYLNLAIEARANCLVTRDRDMLDLMRDPAFRARYPFLWILDPVALLQLLDLPTTDG